VTIAPASDPNDPFAGPDLRGLDATYPASTVELLVALAENAKFFVEEAREIVNDPTHPEYHDRAYYQGQRAGIELLMGSLRTPLLTSDGVAAWPAL
jgi:hypothetical protein